MPTINLCNLYKYNNIGKKNPIDINIPGPQCANKNKCHSCDAKYSYISILINVAAVYVLYTVINKIK